MIGLLVNLLIVALVAGLLFYVVSIVPIPAPWGRVVQAVIGVVVVIWLIQMILPLASGPGLQLR